MKNSPQAEDRAGAASAVMDVPAALGLKEDAAQAATILHARDAAVGAETSLLCMIAAVLK